MAGLAIAASMLGTSLGKLLLERLTDTQFRAWSNRIITAIAAEVLDSVVTIEGIKSPKQLVQSLSGGQAQRGAGGLLGLDLMKRISHTAKTPSP